MKLLLAVFLGILLVVLIAAKPFQDGQQQGDKSTIDAAQKREQAVDLLRRITREAGGGAAKPACKYQKGPWSACDAQTKKRSRTFTLKKGSKSECESQKVLTKDCGKKRGQKQKGDNQKTRERKRQNKKGDKNRKQQQQQQQE